MASGPSKSDLSLCFLPCLSNTLCFDPGLIQIKLLTVPESQHVSSPHPGSAFTSLSDFSPFSAC